MSEEEAGGKISRRDFLKNVSKGTAAAVILNQPGAQALENFANKVDARKQAQTETIQNLDIIPREELESRYRTRIWDLPQAQFPDDYVEMEIRRSAAEELLFQRLEGGRIIGLDIILVDSDSVDPNKLTSEQRELVSQHSTILDGLERKVEEVQELNRQEITANRDKMRAEYQQKLAKLDGEKGSLSNDKYNVERQALDYVYDRYLSEEPSAEDLKEIGVRGYTSMQGTGENERGEKGPRSFVFLAIRDKQKEVTITSGTESKTISASRIPGDEGSSTVFAPKPEQSYPDENTFQTIEDPNSNGYVVVGGHTPGFIFRHEASHARGVFAEDDADKVALEGIVNAASHMKETGSDEKYWVVFKTPEGITLTKSDTDLNSKNAQA